MQKKLLKGLAIALSCFIAIPCFAQVSEVSDGYLFRMKFTKGKVYTFLAPSQISGISETPIKIRLKIYLKVLSTSRGITKVKGTMVSPLGLGSSGGSQSAVMEVNDLGNLTGAGGSFSSLSVTYPSQPLKIGETFESKVPTGFTKGNQPSYTTENAKFKFVGFEKYQGKLDAKFTFRCADPSKPHGMLLVSKADGIIDVYQTRFQYSGSTNTPIEVSSTLYRKS